MNNEIADAGRRHVQAEWLPIVAVIEGNVDRALRAREEQALTHRVFAHDVDRRVVGQAMNDACPSLSGGVGPVDVRSLVVEPNSVDGRVSGCRIEMSGI